MSTETCLPYITAYTLTREYAYSDVVKSHEPRFSLINCMFERPNVRLCVMDATCKSLDAVATCLGLPTTTIINRITRTTSIMTHTFTCGMPPCHGKLALRNGFIYKNINAPLILMEETNQLTTCLLFRARKKRSRANDGTFLQL